MIINFVIINGIDYTSQVKAGVSLSFRIDTELDNGSIILPYTDNPTAFTPYTTCFVSFQGGGFYSYLIEADQVVTIGTNPVKYQHMLTLIEPTKILEKYIINNMTFTQPITVEETNPPYTLLQAIQRIIDNYPLRVINTGGKIIDSISTDLQNQLAGIKAPELTIRQTTMREAIDRLLSYVNALARIRIDYTTGARILEADFYDKLLTLVSNSSGTNISKVRTGDSYALAGTLNLENGTQQYSSVNFPGGKRYAGVRSSDPVVNDQNLLFILPYPIYEIEELNIFCKVSEYTDNLFQTYNGTYEKEADISAFVLEKQLWDALPEPTVALQEEGKKHKMNTLYYTRGDNKIYNIGGLIKTSGFQFLYDRTIDAILTLTVSRTNSDTKRMKWAAGTIPGVFNQASFVDLLFNARFKTIISTKVRANRDSKEDYITTDTPLNQADNLIDLELMGNNARGTINKIGNEDMIITKRVNSWNDRFQTGQYTTDGYIITTAENMVYKDYVATTGHFTKNYNGLSKFVGVDQEYRQIPLPLQTTPTRLIYEQFIVASATAITPVASPNNNFMTPDFVSTFGNYLRPNATRTNIAVDKIYKTTSADSLPDFFGGLEFKTPSTTTTTYIAVQITTAIAGTGANVLLYDMGAPDAGTYEAISNPVAQRTFFTPGIYNFNITPDLLPNRVYRLVIRRFEESDNNTDDFAAAVVNYRPDHYIKEYHVLFTGRQQFFSGFLNTVGAAVDVSNFNNAFKFDFRFESNRFAGTNTSILDLFFIPVLVRSLNQVPYADRHARMTGFSFQIGETSNKIGYASRILEARTYPLMDTGDFDNFIVSTPVFSYNKDSSEELQMTYQVSTVVNDTEKDTIVLGKFFLTKMFKYSDLNDGSFRIYASTTEYYGRNDISKAKGSKLSSTNPYTVTTQTSTHPYRVTITPSIDLSSYKSWSIANENGDLIIAVNRQNPRTLAPTNLSSIVLTFTDRR